MMFKKIAPPAYYESRSRPPVREDRSTSVYPPAPHTRVAKAAPGIGMIAVPAPPPKPAPIVRPSPPPPPAPPAPPTVVSAWPQRLAKAVKVVGLPILLVASLAFGQQTITAPRNAAPVRLFPGASDFALNGIAVVTEAPFNAVPFLDNPTINPLVVPPVDSAPSIQAAINSLIPGPPFNNGPDGGTVYLPAGVYYTKCPAGGGPAIGFKSANGAYSSSGRGLVIEGAGQGATLIVSDTSGTGCALIGSATPHTCDANSGTGSCDAPPGCAAVRSTRGVGCPCYANLDCGGTGTCTGGRLSRNVVIRDLGLVVQKDNMVGIDLAYCTTCKVSNVTVDVATGVSHTNITDLVLSDGSQGASTLGGYDNDITGSNFAAGDVCIRVMKSANDQRIYGNTIGNTCGSGIVVEAAETVFITHNLLQSTRAPVCSGGTTCSGGYHGGVVPAAAKRACAVGSDCGEADVILAGFCSTGAIGDVVAFNHIEDGNNLHVALGDGGGTAQKPYVTGNAHFGAGQAVKNILSQSPYVWELSLASAPITADAQFIEQGATSGTACAATNPGRPFYDTTCGVLCFCNGQATPRYCRQDTGVCGSSTTDCC